MCNGKIEEGYLGFPCDASGKKKTCMSMMEIQETWVCFQRCFQPSLEREMATHSSIFGWKTAWTEEPGGLQSMRQQSVRHD